MDQTLSLLGSILFINTEEVQKLWHDTFGPKFEKYWGNINCALEKIVSETQKILNESGYSGNERNGHATLFLRDPLSDRLNLIFSTASFLNPNSRSPSELYFSEKSQNYDFDKKICYYQLYDRLTPDELKGELEARENRGLTGWVAVTGCPLRINSERAQPILEEIYSTNPIIHEKCKIYGVPTWGRHIAEFIIEKGKKAEKWTKRFLAVPIKSIIDPSITIGVLRYTCTLEERELTRLDLPIIQSISDIISTVLNLDRIKRITMRDSLLELEMMKFRKTGNFYNFLKFIADSLGSEISSLYISIELNGREIVRLFDAYGISDEVGILRSEDLIKDHDNDMQGLTWELFNSKGDSVKVYKSVIDSNNWRGLNTEVFYKKHLSRLGIQGIDNLGKERRQKELLKTYSIKLMGMGLESDGNPLGVLKVEFPTTFDSSLHYEKDDQRFFEKCTVPIKEELSKYKSFISCEWFKKKGNNQSEEFVRLLSYILRTGLVKKDEGEQFWKNVDDYMKKHSEDIKKASVKHFKGFTCKEQDIWKNIFINIHKWLPQMLVSKLIDILAFGIKSWLK